MAFVGRSNVGKSSLFNALVGKKGLARVSGTPGKTRLLNVFRLLLPMLLLLFLMQSTSSCQAIATQEGIRGGGMLLLLRVGRRLQVTAQK